MKIMEYVDYGEEWVSFFGMLGLGFWLKLWLAHLAVSGNDICYVVEVCALVAVNITISGLAQLAVFGVKHDRLLFIMRGLYF